MPVTFFPAPMPVIVEDKEAYAIYVESGGQFENDIWTCCHCDTGIVRHYTTKQVLINKNATFGLIKPKHENTTNP